MHITKIELHNIRCFEQLTWEMDAARCPGWHVILGDNGTGKTTFLKSICLATYNIKITTPLNEVHLFENGKGASIIKISINHSDYIELDLSIYIRPESGWPSIKHTFINTTNPVKPIAFGSFRRSTGGDSRYDAILKDGASPAAACLTLFVESAALREAPKWLSHLRAKSFENRALRASEPDREGVLLDELIKFVNQGGEDELLANGARIEEVTVDEVYFIDGHGSRVTIWELSEGYQSVLSIVLETLRLMAARAADGASIFAAQGDERVVDVEGVILIDEVDAHLHPDWQTRIGRWFVRRFPKIQFIVTTHSPLICQAVALGGSVFKLAEPGSEEQARFLAGPELDRLVYGNILDAYGTGVFGEVTRAPEAEAMRDELAKLNAKALDEGLSTQERKRREALRAVFSTES